MRQAGEPAVDLVAHAGRDPRRLRHAAPAADYDGLADAARGRSRADWLVGMNLSRAYTLAYDEDLSVGRVQTPTLAMLVERELAIRRFVPEDYLEVVATFRPTDAPKAPSYHGTWFRERAAAAAASGADKESLQQSSGCRPDGEEAKRIVDACAHRPGARSSPSTRRRSACRRRRSTT